MGLTVPFVRVAVGDAEVNAAAAAVRSGWLSTGPRVAEFATQFAQHLGVHPDGVVPTASCTAATHIALQVAGVGPGDAVFVPSISFPGPANIARHLGAEVVLVDVEADTCNLSPDRLAEAMEMARRRWRLRPRAVVPVHLWGHPCDVNGIIDVLRDDLDDDVFVLEDCAHAVGARYRPLADGDTTIPVGSETGSHRASVFSFYATKNLACGEGGALVADAGLAGRARPLVLHGMSSDAHQRAEAGSWYYDIVDFGHKANMADPAAAVGIAQLARLDAMQARRAAIAAQYSAGLADLHLVRLPEVRPGVTHAWHLYVIRLVSTAGDRQAFMDALARRGVGTNVHFTPLQLLSAHRRAHRADNLAVAEWQYSRMISLPIYPDLTDAQVECVIEAVHDVAQATQ